MYRPVCKYLRKTFDMNFDKTLGWTFWKGLRHDSCTRPNLFNSFEMTLDKTLDRTINRILEWKLNKIL